MVVDSWPLKYIAEAHYGTLQRDDPQFACEGAKHR